MKSIHQQIFQDCFSDLIGLPYEEKDCYQLAVLFYQKVFTVRLIGYLYNDPMDRHEIAGVISMHHKDFLRVSKPEFGDMILINILGLPAHIGIYLGEGKFLHTSKKLGSHIDRIANWEKRIEGYYSHDKGQIKRIQ